MRLQAVGRSAVARTLSVRRHRMECIGYSVQFTATGCFKMKLHDIKTVGIIGGDKRQLFLADSFAKDGFRVLLGGFDTLESFGAMAIADVRTVLAYSDIFLLPLPPLRSDGSLNAPFAREIIRFDNDELMLLAAKPVFTSMQEKLLRAYPALRQGRVYDYAARDDFAIRNAVPTAEGALACAMGAYEGTVAGSRALVVGYGRIGKVLARLLHAVGAQVTVSARRAADLAYIEALGYRAVRTDELQCVREYQLVFNTVPALIFDSDLLKNTAANTLIIDLASAPGGVDFEAARVLKIDAQRALGLPGRCAPQTAGEIIKTTVCKMIEEVNR